AHPEQHGTPDGHLAGPGAFGNFKLLGRADLTDTNDIVADVGVDPSGKYAYLAHWGVADCAANSESGGVNDPDAGVFVVDINDLRNPKRVGFIPHSQDSRPGEGVQAVNIGTKAFNGTMLVTNNEQCGKNGKGGVSLFDVTNPLKPVKLSEHFGDRGAADTNDIHSAFAWDAGDKAYVVMTDNFEATDVDILDITNPKRPRLVKELNLNTAFGRSIDQPLLGLEESSLHDMTVKQIDGRFVMLLSYWDGGYVRLDVTDPQSPTFIDDTDFTNPDPELLESTGKRLPPEGNGHQAEFTADNRYFIGTDEDFSPYRADFTIDSGPAAGTYPAGEFGFTPPVLGLPDKKLNGPVVYGGYGCPADRRAIPQAATIFPSVAPGEERIILFQRGPVQDPSAAGDACFFSEKIESGQLAGYDGVIVANHHVGAQGGDA
ncbi:MAG: LVIVD repeat-containing protein, partial [Nocardioidaceae bacterium]